MAVTESSVHIIDQSPPTKKIDNTQVTTAEGAVQRQQIGIADPETPGARAKVTNAMPGATDYGVVAREPAPSYDSGLIVGIPTSITTVTSATIRLIGIFVTNVSGAMRKVTVTNLAGGVYLNEFSVPANSGVFIPFGKITIVGIRWMQATGAAGSLNGQIVGEQ